MRGRLRVGLAILAAGSSSRLGRPKQLVEFKGKKLLQHVIDEASEVNVVGKWVILGANHRAIREQINLGDFKAILNEKWEEGMGSSVRIAVQYAEDQKMDALLIVLSDQPYVNKELLNELIGLYELNKELIMASEYNDILGVPALFDRAYYMELSKLSGDSGAKKMINAFRAKVKSVKFEKGWLDIDTLEDLNSLKQSEDADNN